MGLIADALRANLQTIARSDARQLRELDRELSTAGSKPDSGPPESLSAGADLKALLGKGSFQNQTVVVLKQLCRKHLVDGAVVWTRSLIFNMFVSRIVHFHDFRK